MQTVTRYTLYALLFFLPFSLRLPLFSFTPGFHEYETVFLGLYDILLVLFLLFFLFSYRLVWQRHYLYLLGFLCFGALSIFISSTPLLSFYGLIRLSVFILAMMAVASLVHNRHIKVSLVLLALFLSSLVQGLIGFLQFTLQRDLGLWFLGEPSLSLYGNGVSTVLIEGGRVLRAYGTLPHPNILGAFLLVGFLSGLYWIIKIKDARRFLFLGSMFFILLGLFLSLSRSTLVALIFGVILFFVLRFYSFGLVKKNIISLWYVVLLFVFALLPTYIFVLPRANISSSEIAVTSRVSYIEMGQKIIKNNLLGVGLKNQVYHAYKDGIYKKFGMNNFWQWQPIHNIYLLIASEVGVLGLLFFMLFVFSFLRKRFLEFLNKKREENIALLSIVSSLFVLGLFDHFLWTIDSPALLFWIVIGLLV